MDINENTRQATRVAFNRRYKAKTTTASKHDRPIVCHFLNRLFSICATFVYIINFIFF